MADNDDARDTAREASALIYSTARAYKVHGVQHGPVLERAE